MSFSVLDPFPTNLGYYRYSYSTIQRLLHGRQIFWQLEQCHTTFEQASLHCCETTSKILRATIIKVKNQRRMGSWLLLLLLHY